MKIKLLGYNVDSARRISFEEESREVTVKFAVTDSLDNGTDSCDRLIWLLKQAANKLNDSLNSGANVR